MKKQETLYEILRQLVNRDKGDQIYKLVDKNENMIIVTMTAKSMLDCLGYSSFLNREVYEIYRNYIILDCEVVIK